jgi:SAM-dependent methyltransferase
LQHVVPAGPGFKDHFSAQSAGYARHRPSYPGELFAYLAGLSGRRLAWDCATGNGQAALALARYFERVIATDASQAQIDAAVSHPGVSYRVATAEQSGLHEDTVDLVTVGQALHWFDTDRFFAEVSRVLVEGGIVAAWCYELCSVSPRCDATIGRLYTDIVGPFWPPERRLIEDRYAGIVFPGTDLGAPEFEMTVRWTADDMLGYLRTWSACQRYRREHGDDPVGRIEDELRMEWDTGRRTVRWPLTVRVARL